MASTEKDESESKEHREKLVPTVASVVVFFRNRLRSVTEKNGLFLSAKNEQLYTR